MLSLEESLKILKETNALLEGHFVLSSGLHSPQYVQCAKLLSYPKKSEKFCKSLSSKIVIGYEIGRLLKKETIFSERVDGKFVLRRDFLIKKNQRVVIVEDVITTGKSSLECSNIIKKMGAIIVGYACIIDRSNGKSLIKDKITNKLLTTLAIFCVFCIANKDNIKNTFRVRIISCNSFGIFLIYDFFMFFKNFI